MTPRPVLLLFGTCQVERIGLILQALPSVCRAYDIHVSLEYPDPITNVVPTPPDDVLRSCELLIYQKKPIRPLPPFIMELVAEGRGTRIPNLCGDPLWPFEVECKHDPRHPELPNGRYPYGDQILSSLVRDSSDDAVVVNRYLEMDFPTLFPMGDMLRQWQWLLDKLEEETAIKISDFILEQWRTKRLFWNTVRPANRLLGEIVRKFLKVIGTPVGESDLASALQGPEQDSLMKPIHPSLLRYWKLTWVSDHNLYSHLDDPPVSQREWYLRYVAYVRELFSIMPQPFDPKTMSMRFWNKFAMVRT